MSRYEVKNLNIFQILTCLIKLKKKTCQLYVSNRLNLCQVFTNRDQQSKTELPALQRQPSEISQDFAVNQGGIIPNPKPASLEPISQNQNAMNNIQPNQSSKTFRKNIF
ncbi:hypothetical protein BpHYR1_043319 [Brachionus plicatilis]|uniref:Uncharacterized protein n=1 Tax=Brachionus plicatilis TaxID=10195 RepID=A0A3M7QIX6_BRAPC|nr:hypothetical protein BpHYR1_043319 [Brachionus plicatilis]